MEEHFKLSDSELERQFIACELNPSVFSHEAHLRLAWINIDKYGLEQAVKNIQNHLMNFVSHLGAEDKYHMTVTIAAVQAVNHFMEKSKSNNFNDFITEFPQLKNKFKELLNSHYSFDIFSSSKAKQSYLEPDVFAFK